MNCSVNLLKTIDSFANSDYSEVCIDASNQKSHKNIHKLQNAKSQSKNTGHWNLLQKELYYIFLKAHQQNFVKKELRRTDKIFKQMSKFITTRGADQCRSHHQKMQKKLETIDNILKEFEQMWPGKGCEEIMKAFENEQTRQNSVFALSVLEPIEDNNLMIQQAVDPTIESTASIFEVVNQLELGISPKGLFDDQVFNIDNYFLM